MLQLNQNWGDIFALKEHKTGQGQRCIILGGQFVFTASSQTLSQLTRTAIHKNNNDGDNCSNQNQKTQNCPLRNPAAVGTNKIPQPQSVPREGSSYLWPDEGSLNSVTRGRLGCDKISFCLVLHPGLI